MIANRLSSLDVDVQKTKFEDGYGFEDVIVLGAVREGNAIEF